MGLGQAGVELEGAVVGVDRLGEPPLGVQGVAQVRVGPGMVGLQRDGAVVGGDGVPGPTRQGERTPRVLWASASSGLSSSAAQAGNRRVPLPRPSVGFAEVEVILGHGGADRDGPADQLDCHVRAARLGGEDTQQMECVGMIGGLREDLAIDRFGLGQPARLVMAQGLPHRLSTVMGRIALPVISPRADDGPARRASSPRLAPPGPSSPVA